MNFTVTINTDNIDDLARIIGALGGDMPELSPEQMATARVMTPAEHLAEQAASAPVAAHPTIQRGPLTVEELKAGMTLKPTATASLNDGSRVAVGDYVMVNGEKHVVEATYRGTLIVADEDGRPDVVKAEDCSAVEPEARGPRPGTAAALLGDKHPAVEQQPAQAPTPAPDAPVPADIASGLRDRATNLIVTEKASVDEVMAEMNRVHEGCKTIDQMTVAQAQLFGQWITAKEQGKNPAFGF